MRHSKSILILGSLVLMALFSGTASAQDGFVPTFEEGPCAFDAPSDADIICGLVDVPEFHADQSGPTIRLAMAIIKSSSDAPSPDPLVMFTGGPGGNIFNLAPSMLASPIRADRDIVLFGERGTFGSEPFLTCPEAGEALRANFAATLAETDALRVEALAACYDRLTSEGVNPNAYNNPERAADVPLVMAALGYDEFNLWGVSGGGLLTQYALRQNPEGIRTIITDSGAFPTAAFEEVWIPLVDNISDSYRLLFETCAADAACNENYPDLETVFFNMIDDLNANPVSLPITHPETGESAEIMLTGDLVITMLTNTFSSVGTFPKTIYDMGNGDFSVISALVPSLYITEGSDYSDGLFQSVACSEIGHLTMGDISTAESYPQIVEAVFPSIQNTFDICSVWGVERVPPGEVLVSDVPALIMEGVFDTNKPPELGVVVAGNFSTNYLIEFPDKAHVVFGPCALQIMAEFMNDPAQAPATSCVAQGVSFVLPGAELSFSPVTLETLGVQAVVPDGWTQAAEGIWTRNASVADQTALVISAVPDEDVAAAVAALAEREDFDAPTALDEISLGNHTWSIFVAAQDDTLAAIAGTSSEGTVYVAVLIVAAADFETLAEPILLPVIEAFTIED